MYKNRFLLKVGSEIYGYDDSNILLIHLIENKEDDCNIYMMEKGLFIIKYNEISIDSLREINKLER